MSSLQVRVAFGKNDEVVDGEDDSDVVVTVGAADATSAGFDPAVAFMRGQLKSTGPTGPLLAALRDGSLAITIARLTSSR
jgi:hypothetical protein